MSISKLKRDVFANDRAADIYLTLRARYLAHGRLCAPVGLAAEYWQSVQARDAAAKLAYEFFVRETTARHCDSELWRDCLADLERHKARGVMGTGAPRMLQDIADAIESAYAAGDYQEAGGRYTFAIDRLRVSCRGTPGAVQILAAKYRRGIGKSRTARYGAMNA